MHDHSPNEGNFLLQVANAPLLRLLLTSEQPSVQNVLFLFFGLRGHLSNELPSFDPEIPQRVQFGNDSSSKPAGMDGRDLSEGKVSCHLSLILHAIHVKFLVESEDDLL